MNDVVLVVCAQSVERRAGYLPSSTFERARRSISGGERSLYEIAFAAATAGIAVELRGDLDRAIFHQLRNATGVQPQTGLPARRAREDDVVVAPEGSPELLVAACVSEGRWVLDLLAPPGLFWSPAEDWEYVDLTRVALESLGTPPLYRALRDLGVALWSNAHGIADAGTRAGVDVTWLGAGTPIEPAVDGGVRTHDVAIITKNRWATWAEQVVAEMKGTSVLRVATESPAYSLGPELAKAKILVWPSRIEGMSRIAREARTVGTVPVVLATNPFATAADHGEGVVLVENLDEMSSAISALLDDATRLASLSAAARRSASEQTNWPAFVKRVAAAVAAVSAAPAPENHELRRFLGDHLRKMIAAEMASARRERSLMRSTARVVGNRRGGRGTSR